MNRPGKSKFFIAVVPPAPVYEAALHWKNFFQQKFNSKAALRSPPHITLHMPFEWKNKKEEALIDSLTSFSKQCSPFKIELKDFGSFPRRVIYIQVIDNPQLTDLQKRLSLHCKTKLNLFNANRKDQVYHPHLTVAFRDLKKSIFPDAWKTVEQEPFRHAFNCDNLCLLKHNGKNWNIHTQLSFISPSFV